MAAVCGCLAKGALAAQRPGFSGRPAAAPFHGAPRVARPESRRRAAAEEAEAAVDAAPGPSGNNQLYFGKDTESLTDVFAFAGPAPERVNGRVAMWAFAAAVAAEAASGRSVVDQLAAAPVSVIFTMLLITAGSLAPKFASGVGLGSLIASASREGLPPQLRFFNKTHEIWVGRVAMLGFTGLVATELVLQRALF